MSFFALVDLINNGPPPPWKPGVITAEEFAEEVTRIHNDYRKLHQAYALRLSEELCDHAQEWADGLINTKELSHSNFKYKGTRISESISMKWSPDNRGYTPVEKRRFLYDKEDNNYGNINFINAKWKKAQEICDQWYHESRTYDFSREPTSLTAGHFTNMVWHNSVEIGVGMSRSPDGRCVVVICYSPPGNVIGEFTSNVLPKLTELHSRVNSLFVPT